MARQRVSMTGKDVAELSTGENSVDLAARGEFDDREALSALDIRSGMPSKEELDAHAFFEELVEVEILPTENPTAEALIPLHNGGVSQWLVRGVPQKIKRKFVEVLAQAQTENVQTREVLDSQGYKTTKIVRSHGLRYPFRVLADTQKGREWLDNLLRRTR